MKSNKAISFMKLNATANCSMQSKIKVSKINKCYFNIVENTHLNNYRNCILKLVLGFMLFGFSQISTAQTIDVTSTVSTCLQNGELSWQVQGAPPSATITYNVIDLSTGVNIALNISASMITGLSPGNYQIDAIIEDGGMTQTISQTSIVDDAYIPLEFGFSITPELCGNDGEIILNITNGNFFTVEVISGPLLTPPQTSLIVSNLPAGSYTLEIMDDCDQDYILALVVDNVPPSTPEIYSYTSGGNELACDEVNLCYQFGFGVDQNIALPWAVEITVFPPDSLGLPPDQYSQTVSTPFGGYYFACQVVTSYDTFEYTIEITDACGNVFTSDLFYGEDVDLTFGYHYLSGFEDCGNCLNIIMNNVAGDSYINFINTPTGFNPSLNDPIYPGPYNNSGSYSFCDVDGISPGIYTFEVTDDCGTVTETIEVFEEENIYVYHSTYRNCSAETVETCLAISVYDNFINPLSGDIYINFTNAPPGFNPSLNDPIYPGPYTSNSNFTFCDANGIPPGTYTFEATYECGDVSYTFEVFEPVLQIYYYEQSTCTLGAGDIYLETSQYQVLTSVIITNAPASYSSTLPVDLSSNITPGQAQLYLLDLPAGSYTIEMTDICGNVYEETIEIFGYQATFDYEIIPGCGSYGLSFEHISNGYGEYYLQYLNPTSGIWEYTDGTPYIPGNYPNYTTPTIANNSTTNNLTFFGDARIVKCSNHIDGSKCPEVLAEYTYDNIVIAFENVGVVQCGDGSYVVGIDVSGMAPFQYEIISIDGVPTNINNGGNSVFTGLQAGMYVFQVTDNCGNTMIRELELTNALPPAITATDICDGEDGKLMIVGFDFLDFEWTNNNDPTTILSTESSLCFSPFDASTDGGIVSVNISFSGMATCLMDVLQYTIVEECCEAEVSEFVRNDE